MVYLTFVKRKIIAKMKKFQRFFYGEKSSDISCKTIRKPLWKHKDRMCLRETGRVGY